MSKAREKQSLNNAVAFISEFTGLPVRLVHYVIKAYSTYAVLELYQGKRHHIPLIGTLSPNRLDESKRKVGTITFKPTSRLQKFTYMTREVEVEEVIKEYQFYLQNGRLKEDLEKHKQRTISVLEESSLQMKNRGYMRTKAMIDVVRNDLLRYLQQEFPYEVDWCHPISSRVYAYTRISNKLKQYRQIDSIGYNLLYSVWVSLSERSEIRQDMGLSEKMFELKLRQVLDTLILLVVHSDIDSEGLSACYCMGLLGLEPD